MQREIELKPDFDLSPNIFFGKIKNFVANMLLVAFALVFISMVLSVIFSMGTTDLLEYAKSMERIETRQSIVEKDETGYFSIRLAEESADSEAIKILHITDVHLGNGLFTLDNDKQTIDNICKLVKNAMPDLIVATGDIAYPFFVQTGTSNNLKSAEVFAETMDSIGIPWAFTFGNHDVEPYATHEANEILEMYENHTYSKYGRGKCLFVSEKTMTKQKVFGKYYGDVFGNTNYFVNVLNADKSLNTMLCLIDSNSTIEGKYTKVYDNIHEDQIEWYAHEIRRISRFYNGEDFFSQSIIGKSLAFYHIPSKEFLTAWQILAKNLNVIDTPTGLTFEENTTVNYSKAFEEVKFFYGKAGETRSNGKAKVSHPLYDDNFFETMKQLGSTKGVFVGHNHKNNFSLKYQGIRLTYGLTLDNVAYVHDDVYRGGTLIHCTNNYKIEDWSFHQEQIFLNYC